MLVARLLPPNLAAGKAVLSVFIAASWLLVARGGAMTTGIDRGMVSIFDGVVGLMMVVSFGRGGGGGARGTGLIADR